MCEAFNIPPVIGGAVDQPIGLTNRILTLRNYKDATDLVDGRTAVKMDEVPERISGLVAKVRSRRYDLDEEEREREEAEEARAAVEEARIVAETARLFVE